MRTVAEDWREFSELVFGRRDVHDTQVCDTQVCEMQKAFYAGYSAAMASMVDLGDPELPVSDGVDFVTDRHAELRKFCADILEDHAMKN